MKRTAIKARRRRDTGPDVMTVALVLERDRRCVVCCDPIRGTQGIDWAVHHRKLKSQGVDNRPSNLICVCTKCHTDIHAAPAKAREAGWMLRGTDDPAEMPIAHSRHGWIYLTDDGSWVRASEEVSA